MKKILIIIQFVLLVAIFSTGSLLTACSETDEEKVAKEIEKAMKAREWRLKQLNERNK